MADRSLYIIKPEAMEFRTLIRDEIRSVGLDILRYTQLIIPVGILDALYPELGPELREATHRFMGSSDCEVGEVGGALAVQMLTDLCGGFTDPSCCGPSTIRGRFGKKCPEHIGNATYYRNAIHRPKDQFEADRDLALFADILKIEEY